MEIFFILVMVMTSIVTVTFIVERGLALRWHKVIPPAVVEVVQRYHSASELPRLRSVCDACPSAVSRLLLFAAEHLDWPREETVGVVETRARHELTQLERGLVVLEIIVGIAPLLGLVGTIWGLITLFLGMGASPGPEQQALFAKGIGDALGFTLGGLLIAIMAVISWSYYSKKVENMAVEMEAICGEFLRRHYRASESEPASPTLRH
ncbi:MAG TPA: MotA/TolQ/ExbB proton channel family protein [Methylomirabilota bacterium]|nr:MotA/TolQ/ExbB proton channel family protein [Methylomirabilota bacterium]